MKDVECQKDFIEKINLFSKNVLKGALYVIEYKDCENVFEKKFYLDISLNAHSLQDCLDFHGAKNNKTWFFYRELAASIYHLGRAAYIQKHICSRFPFFKIDYLPDFEKKSLELLQFLNILLFNISSLIIKEAENLKIKIPQRRFNPKRFPSIITKDRLDYNIIDVNNEEERQYTVQVCSRFLNISDKFKSLFFYEEITIEKIKELIPEKINEVEARRFEMLIHNLKSVFDFHIVIFGDKEEEIRDNLYEFRSCIAFMYYLLQVMGRLLCFYERHIINSGYQDTFRDIRKKIMSVIHVEDLMRYIANYAFYFVSQFSSKGKRLSRELLKNNIEKKSITVKIPMERGFHLRPSVLVANLVNHYGGNVELVVEDKKFDAASPIEIQWAGGQIAAKKITKVVFYGDSRALDDLVILANANYGEDIMGKGVPLPKELKYLSKN